MYRHLTLFRMLLIRQIAGQFSELLISLCGTNINFIKIYHCIICIHISPTALKSSIQFWMFFYFINWGDFQKRILRVKKKDKFNFFFFFLPRAAKTLSMALRFIYIKKNLTLIMMGRIDTLHNPFFNFFHTFLSATSLWSDEAFHYRLKSIMQNMNFKPKTYCIYAVAYWAAGIPGKFPMRRWIGT